MRLDDLDAIMKELDDYYDIGMAENSGFGVVRTSRRSSQGSTVRGVTDRGFELMGLTTDRGRMFLPDEYQNGTRVAVIGADVAVDLFGSDRKSVV